MANHGCISNPCPVCHPAQYERLAAAVVRFEEYDHEPPHCQCECHKPKHEARPPHPSTQIGRLR